MSSRFLIIPMEIIERELNGKLLLSLQALIDDWDCIIGTKKAIFSRANELPKGVVFLKSLIPSEIKNIRTLKNAGHRLVSMDEEGLVQRNLDVYANMRFSKDTIAEMEHILFWGDHQVNALIKNHPEQKDKFLTTGSPTADLWKPSVYPLYEKIIEGFRQRYGRYVLIPSSFGVYNHYMGEGASAEIMKRDNMFQSEQDYINFKAYEAHTGKIFYRFMDLVPKMAKAFPEYHFVVRPHPCENPDPWKRLASENKNFDVVYEGNASPWLLGAEAIVHWGSTTGLEAHLMGRPVIGYDPFEKPENVDYNLLPHSVSIMNDTDEGVIKDLGHVLKHPDRVLMDYEDVAIGHEELKLWIKGLESPIGEAPRNIMSILNAMNVEGDLLKDLSQDINDGNSFKEFVWKILDVLTKPSILRQNLPERIKIGVESRDYGRHKTKPMDESVILENADKLASILGLEGVQINRLGKDLFHLYK